MHIYLAPVGALDRSDNLLVTGKETCLANRRNSFPGLGEAVVKNRNKDANLNHSLPKTAEIPFRHRNEYDSEVLVRFFFCLQITLQPLVLKVIYMSLDLSPNKYRKGLSGVVGPH